ncbi:hypothetical protein PF007_g13415 [Phytophthora fragariae]|uniref:Uncharacterized protein n=2 Tax=Phytophthora fragariae TaxID=53985 RepID=A0A6A3EQ55_9STRA|nr:hypothetical protein PF009_g14442 [Phytophthora fragariae]KAE9026804.1 hypothetical protein PF011_g2363 [Phytophthora fragariae]KAE9106391.1 hypothetical protein PF007_g13415 [Phytophthora fragariae]KAE9139360.1 hypothetical protein PF006_g13755 [Phytophthora fragariae]KAE9223444.1 hypothetical protein PF004_g12512 [Phytophthora fragariae]
MVNKRWSIEEEYTLLEFLSSHLEQYTKGVKTKFYESALVVLPLKSATRVKSKCIELESSYKTYKAKLSRSGFGVNATDPSSIKEPGTTVRNGLMLPRQPVNAAFASTVATPVAARTLVPTNLPVSESMMEKMTAVSSINTLSTPTAQTVDSSGAMPAVLSMTNSPTRPDANLLSMPDASPHTVRV